MESGRVFERGTPTALTQRYLSDGSYAIDAENRSALVAWLVGHDLAADGSGPFVVRPGIAIADLVAQMVSDGIRLTRLEPQRATLERLYLEMRRRTRGMGT
jgi:hypothetical protein